MKKIFALALVAATFAISQARAEVIDVSTIKCSDLTAMTTDDASYLLIWLHGYYGGKAEDTTIDLKSFETVAGDMGAKCVENPDLGIMTAVQQVTQ